jgi:hypothetical protein
MTRRLAVGLAAALLAVLGACSSDQDPGLTPDSSSTDGPSTTSHLLPRCDSTPDATVPAGGCVGDDGAILRPGSAP